MKTIQKNPECKRCGLLKSTVDATDKDCIFDEKTLEGSHDFGLSKKEPEEAWEDKLDQWWLEHERAFAVPVAVTRDDVAIFVRQLLSQQRTQTIEEIKKALGEMEDETKIEGNGAVEWTDTNVLIRNAFRKEVLTKIDSLK